VNVVHVSTQSGKAVELGSVIDQDQALELLCVCVFLIAPIILLRPANRTPPPVRIFCRESLSSLKLNRFLNAEESWKEIEWMGEQKESEDNVKDWAQIRKVCNERCEETNEH